MAENKYRDPQNKVHQIDPAFEHLLPEGSVKITDFGMASMLGSEKVLHGISVSVQHSRVGF